MIPIPEILSRFSKVYKSGEGEYQCLCPSHDDSTASLGLKFKEDKMILNCFAGCSMESILQASGLDWGDVMPDSRDDDAKGSMKFNPYAVLKATRNDVLFVALCASQVSNSSPLEDSDKQKLLEVTSRLRGLYNDIK